MCFKWSLLLLDLGVTTRLSLHALIIIIGTLGIAMVWIVFLPTCIPQTKKIMIRFYSSKSMLTLSLPVTRICVNFSTLYNDNW